MNEWMNELRHEIQQMSIQVVMQYASSVAYLILRLKKS